MYFPALHSIASPFKYGVDVLMIPGAPMRGGLPLRASLPGGPHSLSPGAKVIKRRTQRAVGKTAFERDVEVCKGFANNVTMREQCSGKQLHDTAV